MHKKFPIQNNPQRIAKYFYSFAKVAKFRLIWSHMTQDEMANV